VTEKPAPETKVVPVPKVPSRPHAVPEVLQDPSAPSWSPSNPGSGPFSDEKRGDTVPVPQGLPSVATPDATPGKPNGPDGGNVSPPKEGQS